MKWISVKDKLPENKQIVLAYTEFGEQAVCCSKVDTQYFFILNDTNLQIKNVTHWMSLPDCPEIAEKKQRELDYMNSLKEYY